MSGEIVKTAINEQFAVRYENHYSGGKVVTLGNYDAAMDTTDIVRDLRRQGFEPTLLRREITVTYSDWAAVSDTDKGEQR